MFNHKYAPQKFSDLVFQNDVVKKRLEAYVLGKKKDNILIYGPYGTAKSTTARIIAIESRKQEDALFEIGVDAVNCVKFCNHAADKISFDVVERGWSMSGQKFPYAVLDEFDLLSQAHQDLVRDVMDRNLGRAGFILTTNHLHRIDGAIQSRCDIVELPRLQSDVLLDASQKILKTEGVTISDKIVLKLISNCQGDWRALLRQLEEVVNGIRQKTAA